MTRWIHPFYIGQPPRQSFERALLGGKGANLASMCAQGLPVPPGFTILTTACSSYYQNDKILPSSLVSSFKPQIKALEDRIGRIFGDSDNPLLVSVRSGASVSMPGMMDTVLNLGLNDDTVIGLAKNGGDERFAWDCFRRFIQMYGQVVLGIPNYLFEDVVEEEKDNRSIIEDSDMVAEGWQNVVSRFQAIVKKDTGSPFPQDPYLQLENAVAAVFESWQSMRAKVYRKLNRISDDLGTAVTVQAMVFGNLGDNCATGVAFTRNPKTGEAVIFGEYLPNAQGEDIVAGVRTPYPIISDGSGHPSLSEAFPEAWQTLEQAAGRLEGHFCDMQDIEFTIENGKLYLLQTRKGKRSAQAALRISAELVETNIITRDKAIQRIDPLSLQHVLHSCLDPRAPREVITRGLPASPGAASGKLAFTADDAVRLAAGGHDIILVRTETSPDDILGMHASRGILTSRGGMTSHAAVVARSMGRVCISGVKEMHVDEQRGSIKIGEDVYSGEDIITLDGSTGEVLRGRVATVSPKLTAEFKTILGWSDERRKLKVRANADSPEEAETALKFGAQGIGLCRTEHMFFQSERIQHMQRMVMSVGQDQRKQALEILHPFQVKDFISILKCMGEFPVAVRLLDPPLHEFLPRDVKDYVGIAELMGVDASVLRQRALMLRETNPMLGHRGCRLLICYPEIIEMQCRALFEAAYTLFQSGQKMPHLEIMIPLIASVDELRICRGIVDRVAKEIASETKISLDYSVGTMIELPRAALCAGELAEFVDFFSFGTNDLTQTTWGISRDDCSGFFQEYEKQGILPIDPFMSLDRSGVGQLIAMAVTSARSKRPDIKLGVCGEHGGDPDSITFFHRLGLDYISCSPFRLPGARLAAAQAAIEAESEVLVEEGID